MCYLIHVGVPAKHAGSVPPGRVPHVAAHENPSVSAAFGRSFATFSVSESGCACGLYSSPDAPAPRGRDAATVRRKYERLGWSEAKIARAMAAFEESPRGRRNAPGLRQDIVELVSDLVSVAGEVRLIVHHYEGSFAEERVEPRESRKMSAAEFRNGGGSEVVQDVVYVVRA